MKGKASSARSLARLRNAALAAVLLLLALPAPARGKIIFRPESDRTVGLEAVVADLRTAQVVLFGERHSSIDDHVAQRTLIQGLHDAGADIAIGLEMFRSEAQPELDAWSAGSLDANGMRAVFARNWAGSQWELYNDILSYAQQERIPLVGLNLPSEIVNRVSRGGLASLTEQERRDLDVGPCRVTPRYENVMRILLGESGGNFTNFCEAQMIWDTVMARRIIDYQAANPKRTIVVLCGIFHAWRHGIPEQIRRLSPLKTRVILPSGDTTYLKYDIMLEDADYVWWKE